MHSACVLWLLLGETGYPDESSGVGELGVVAKRWPKDDPVKRSYLFPSRFYGLPPLG